MGQLLAQEDVIVVVSMFSQLRADRIARELNRKVGPYYTTRPKGWRWQVIRPLEDDHA
jgi:recombination DNA repair RAD52 pathway protein